MKLHELFYLSKSDRLAVVLLIVLALAALVALQQADRVRKTFSVVADSTAVPRQSSYQNGKSNRRFLRSDNRIYRYDEGSDRVVETFPFDPNTADSTQLLRLGLQPWQVKNVYRYRNRGGVYREPDDFARLYGLTRGEFLRLKPYIRIAPEFQPAARFVAERSERTEVARDTVKYPVKIAEGEFVNLNTADTSHLKKVPGIGSYFARRIVTYRQRLGGFYSTAQLEEIEGFPHEALKFFKTEGETLRKMNLNTMSYSQLRAHPYMNFYQVRDVLDFRRLHGSLRGVADLQLLKSFPPEALERLKPYITF